MPGPYGTRSRPSFSLEVAEEGAVESDRKPLQTLSALLLAHRGPHAQCTRTIHFSRRRSQDRARLSATTAATQINRPRLRRLDTKRQRGSAPGLRHASTIRVPLYVLVRTTITAVEHTGTRGTISIWIATTPTCPENPTPLAQGKRFARRATTRQHTWGLLRRHDDSRKA